MQSTQELLQRLPIVVVPSPLQVVEIPFGKPFMVQDHKRSPSLRLEHKRSNGIDAGIPMSRPPGLHDSLARNQLDIPSDDLASEHGKSSARFRVDLRRHTGECSELLCIQKHLIDALRPRLQL